MATDNNSSVLRAIFARTFVAISLINMLGMVGYYAIFVICTHFAAEQFGASLAMAGLATGIVVIGCLVGRFFLRVPSFTLSVIDECSLSVLRPCF